GQRLDVAAHRIAQLVRGQRGLTQVQGRPVGVAVQGTDQQVGHVLRAVQLVGSRGHRVAPSLARARLRRRPPGRPGCDVTDTSAAGGTRSRHRSAHRCRDRVGAATYRVPRGPPRRPLVPGHPRRRRQRRGRSAVSASPTDRLLALLRADPDRFTKDLYATLFALAPETREMFPANMAEQRQVLFDTLELLLTGLGTEDEQDLIAFLAQLGRDHRRYGVTSAHYQAFTKALVKQIRDRVGPASDPAPRTVIVRLAEITAATMDGAARAEAEHLPAYWEATVLEHHRLTRDLALVRLQADAAVPYLPGQYVSVQVPQAPGQWRFLSPTIPADAHGLLEFQVRAVDGGQVSPRIVTGTGVGDRWRIGAPHGALEVDRQAGSDVLMIAGGS